METEWMEKVQAGPDSNFLTVITKAGHIVNKNLFS